MEYTTKNRPDKQFGFWKEYGDNYHEYPSVWDFVDSGINSSYDKDKLLSYLEKGAIMAVTSRMGFPSPFTGKIEYGSISIMTDGEWFWLDNISEMIRSHDLIIPEAWYREIEKRGFIMPEIKPEQQENTE